MVPCFEQPIPGWLENFSGPTGILSAIGNGVLRTLICDQNCVFDLVPVDTVINLLIVTAWQKATNKSCEMKVYNCVSCRQNPITWGDFIVKTKKYLIYYPLEGVFWYPTFAMRKNRQLNMLMVYLVQYLPAYFIDLFAWIMGKNSM